MRFHYLLIERQPDGFRLREILDRCITVLAPQARLA
jgi:hypothetical protein